MRALLLILLPAGALAAPLPLYAPPAGDFAGKTLAPSCGDLATPCASAPLAPVGPGQATQGQASLSYTPPGAGWTYGGSVATGVGGVSGAKGAATAVAGSLWARSPDGQWTVAVGVAHQTFPAWGYNAYPTGPGAFGHR